MKWEDGQEKEKLKLQARDSAWRRTTLGHLAAGPGLGDRTLLMVFGECAATEKVLRKRAPCSLLQHSV